MSYDDLDRELRDMATDAPDSGSVRTAVRTGFARRQKRVRTVALVATATVVVVIVGGISLGGKIGLSSGPAAPGSDWQQHVRPVIIPQGSTLTPFTDDTRIISPVTPTVDAPGPDDTLFWEKDVDSLSVVWFPPSSPAGSASPSADPSASASLSSPDPATTNATNEPAAHGYVISASAEIPVQSSDSGAESSAPAVEATAPYASAPVLSSAPSPSASSPSPTKPSARSTMIAGHAVVISDVQNSSWSNLFPVTRWVTWKLSGGRYVHVWANASTDSELLAFAAGIVERPTEFARHMTVGVTLPGYSLEGIAEFGSPGYLDGGVVDLCPVGTKTIFWTTTTVPCLSVTVMAVKNLGIDQTGNIQTATVDGVTSTINRDATESSADVGRGFGVLVSDYRAKGMPNQDYAALAASVRLDPAVKLGSSPYTDPPSAVSEQNDSGSASASASAAPGQTVTVEETVGGAPDSRAAGSSATATSSARSSSSAVLTGSSTVPRSQDAGPASSAAAVPSAG